MSGTITVVNHSSTEIHASISVFQGSPGNESFYVVTANGGTNTWARTGNQVVRFARSTNAGATIENVLAIPGQSVHIY